MRLTSQGESRFQWMAGAFYEDVYDWWQYGAHIPGYMSTTSWAYAQYLAYYYNAQGYDIQYPLAPTEIYYYEQLDRTVKQPAVFGEMTYDLTDKWSVTGGARWFEYERDTYEIQQTPLGYPVGSDFEGGGVTASSGKDTDTVFKFATQYHFNDQTDDLRALQRGLPPRRQQRRTRRGDRHPAAQVQAGHPQELRSRHQEPWFDHRCSST